MTIDNNEKQSPKTFDQLWEESEQLSLKQYKDKPTTTIVKKLTELLSNYEKIEPLGMVEIKTSLQKRYMGEILFLLSALSVRDNINIYPLLCEQIVINQ